MTNSMGRLAALLLATAIAMPVSVGAQEPPKKPGAAAPAKPAAPAAKPAAPAPHPAPAARAAPAPHPAPAARVAPSHPAPQRAAIPHVAPQRTAAPQPRIQERAQRHEQHIQQRQQARPQTPAPQLKQQAQTQQLKQQAQTPQQTVNPRQAQRQERILRRNEARALRSLPPQQRAAKREEFQRAREQRTAGRQQIQPNAAAAPSLASTQSTHLRRNGQARVTAQQAQQGRFASSFASARNNNTNARGSRVAAREAWRNGHRAGFRAWYGPVFWPYAYSDVFDYAFWPGGYDDGYFAYAYDDFFDGVFFGEGGPPPEYVQDYAGVGPSAAPTQRANYAAVQELCKQPGSGVTAWPVADIEKKVGLNDEQKQLLADVKNAGIKAADAFKASCPSENAFPMTPPGRLTAMTARLDATLEAVQTVKPALERFYASLSDEQKERFNQIGPKQKVADNATTGQASADESKSCKEQKPGLTNLPMQSIEDAVKPTNAQAGKLKNLEDATAKAVSVMQAACPEETPITPPGRLEAMETRLKAMIEAANTVKPALSSFYGSLNAEQKARFNRIGSQLAQQSSN